MEVGPQPHHIAVGGGPNHDGRTPIMQAGAPVVPSGITHAEGYLSVEWNADGASSQWYFRGK
jgi:hypothetical protein